MVTSWLLGRNDELEMEAGKAAQENSKRQPGLHIRIFRRIFNLQVQDDMFVFEPRTNFSFNLQIRERR